MANSSLDLSDRAVLGSLARLLSAVRRAASDTPVLLVGAAARDLLLVYAHGVDVQRATEDTDLALAVRSWEAFLHLRDALITSGDFTADGPPHRLWFGDQRLDIIPFGGVERPDRSRKGGAIQAGGQERVHLGDKRGAPASGSCSFTCGRAPQKAQETE